METSTTLHFQRVLRPKVIWLRGCDYPTGIAERLLRDQAIRVTEFLQDPERAILIIRP